jgi:CubicO group peptidase (beta-lactamase class C family)
MRPHILAFALAAALPVVAAAQTSAAPAGAPSPAALPDSPLGRLGQKFLDLVDSGDSSTIASFVRQHLGHDVRGRTPAQMSAMLVKLHAQSGGLRVERTQMAGSALRLMTQARNGRRWLGIELEAEGGDSTRIGEVTMFPIDDGGRRMPPKPWADGQLDDARIAEIIRGRVKQAVDSDKFSGVVLVAHGDRVLVHDVYGFADREHNRANTKDTPFATYSLGKMFTSVAIAQLVSQGKLSWDDTLATVLSSYPNPEAAKRITIRQLLTHTAGVPDPFLSKRYGGKQYPSHEAMLPDFADAPLNANHGKSFDYSNGNFAVLAAVVERLSGLSYVEYLRRNVWGPAGMKLPTEGAAIGYARFTELDPLGVEPRRPETVRGGRGVAKQRAVGFGGGAYTAEDLYRFARALRTGKLVPMGIADSITKGEVSMGGPMKYALGFFDRTMHDRHVVGHSGSNPDTGHDADLEMLWDGQWTVVVLSNYDAPAGMMLEMPILDLLAGSTTAAGVSAKK